MTNMLYRILLVILLSAGIVSMSEVAGQGYRILPLGNSLTQGAGSLPLDQRVSYRLQLRDAMIAGGYSIDYVGHRSSGDALLPLDPEHCGIPGFHDQHVLQLLTNGYDAVNDIKTTPASRPYLDWFTADFILLHIGTSDIAFDGEGSGADTVAQILDKIEEWEADNGSDVVVFVARIVNTTPYNPVITDFNDNVAAIVAGRGDPTIRLVDMESGAGILYGGDFEADGIHLLQSGYDKMGAAWFKAIDFYIASLPDAPDNLGFTNVTDSSMRVTWVDNSDNETGFVVERSLAAEGPFAEIGTTGVDTAFFDDSGLEDVTTYYYRVKAVNATGMSEYISGSETTLLSPPNAPASLDANASGSCTVELRWVDMSDNEDGFLMERSILPAGGFTPLDVIAPNSESYTDATTLNHTTYYYRLSAFNSGGNSDYVTASVTVSFILDGGQIGEDQKLCPTGDPAIIANVISPSGGSNNWSYQWQSRTPPALSFGDIAGATDLFYDPPSGILETTEFQRISTVECGSVASNVVTITTEDSEDPLFTVCPNDITVEIERDETTGSIVTQDPLFTDNCEVVLLTWSMSGATTGASPASGINYLGTALFQIGTTTVTYVAEDFAGNTSTCQYSVTVEIRDPHILDVTIPGVSMKIGDVITATIQVANDGGSVYTLVSGDIGGYPLYNLQRINNTEYRASFEVAEGGNSYLAEEDIPVGSLVVSDGTTPSQPYATPISQDNDLLDAEYPVVTDVSVGAGDYGIGDMVVLDIVADGTGYEVYSTSSINDVAVTEPNILFSEPGGGAYRLVYQVEEGDISVGPGELKASVTLIKPSGNVGQPYTMISNVDEVTIDAHPPVITRMEVPSIEVGVGGTVQVTILADEAHYAVAAGTVINGIPVSSPDVTFSEIAGGLYELSYVVGADDAGVAPGELDMTLLLRDGTGNLSAPYAVIEPNLLEIYTDIPSALLTGTSEVCEDEEADLVLFLNGGRAPWSIDLSSGTETTSYEGITGDEFHIMVQPDSTTTYRVTRVTDLNGVEGNMSNSRQVQVNAKTAVNIINLAGSYSIEDDPQPLEADVPGGLFSGPGVFTNPPLFDPGLADTVDSPHTIYYTFTNQGGCVSVDSALVFVLGAEGDIYLPYEVVCEDADPFMVTASNVEGVTGSFLLHNQSGQVVPGLTDNGDNTATILPSQLTSGNYTVEYAYFDEVTLYLRRSFIVEGVQTPGFTSPDKFTLCHNVDLVALTSTVAGAIFTGSGVSGNVTDGFWFDPGEAGLGTHTITCTATTAHGCSESIQQNLDVVDVPKVRFAINSACISQDGSEISFSNLTTGKLDVERWSWDFGDPSSGEQNRSDLIEPAHFYETSGSRTINLMATTYEGCVDQFAIDTVIGMRPAADFTWITDCFKGGTETRFLDRSALGSGDLDLLRWTFRASGGSVLSEDTTASSADTVSFYFGAINTYRVDLHVRGTDGCWDETSKELTLRPTISLQDRSYEEDFNDSESKWTTHSDSTAISWIWDTPDFEGFNVVAGDRAWLTHLPDLPDYTEHSWVQSPCFDFTGMDVPMIKLDLMRSFVPDFVNGAVLQYQNVVEEGWKTVGRVSSGIQWYNASDIENRPGGSSAGWGLEEFNPDSEWITAVHDLDEVMGESHISFRVAIATAGVQEIGNQGFAFDNIAITERTRRVVLEHFTSSADGLSRLADDIIDDVSMQNPGIAIDLQYHMDIPGSDPMNGNNPNPPLTRASVNGISDPPYTIMDGGTAPDTRFTFNELESEAFEDQLILLSLEMPAFDIELEVEWSGEEVVSTTTVTSIAPYSENIQLYVVVMEQEVTAYTGGNGDRSFRNVVLDMLPNATGELLGNRWESGTAVEQVNPWAIAPYVEDAEDLVVVAFIQDRSTGRILQSAVEYRNDPVAVAEIESALAVLTLYPNPASDVLFINLGERAGQDGIFELTDMSGRVVENGIVPEGYQLIRVPVEHLDPGIYLVRWIGSGRLKGAGKLVKSR
ncbi:MAG: T9SS type A sorting domain-containing protein [Bacteroidota bacterium]